MASEGGQKLKCGYYVNNWWDFGGLSQGPVSAEGWGETDGVGGADTLPAFPHPSAGGGLRTAGFFGVTLGSLALVGFCYSIRQVLYLREVIAVHVWSGKVSWVRNGSSGWGEFSVELCWELTLCSRSCSVQMFHRPSPAQQRSLTIPLLQPHVVLFALVCWPDLGICHTSTFFLQWKWSQCVAFSASFTPTNSWVVTRCCLLGSCYWRQQTHFNRDAWGLTHWATENPSRCFCRKRTAAWKDQ